MDQELTTGEKIRNFRKRAGLSQFELETAIDASNGSISRIEQGKVNPTKETLLAIADKLLLAPAEKMYMLGVSSVDPTPKEINDARKYFKGILSSPEYYGYLLDTKSQILEISQGFKDIGLLNNINTNKLVGKNIIEVLFDPLLGVRGIIDPEKFDNVAVPVLTTMLIERQYLLNEPWWKYLFVKLTKLPDFNRLWDQVSQNDALNIDLYLLSSRTVHFRFNGEPTPMIYHFTSSSADPRFMLLEYTYADT